MSIGTFIAQSALEEIGAHSLAAPAPPSVIEKTAFRINTMLHRWQSWGIKIPFTQLGVPGDELSEPADTTDAIIFNLAIDISGPFSNGSSATVSSDLRDNARKTFVILKQTYRILTVPNKQVSSTTPRGIGNINGVNSRTFFDDGEPIGG